MVSTFENIKAPIVPGKTQGTSQVLEFLRVLLLQTLQHNIHIRAAHIPGKHNDITDAILILL